MSAESSVRRGAAESVLWMLGVLPLSGATLFAFFGWLGIPSGCGLILCIVAGVPLFLASCLIAPLAWLLAREGGSTFAWRPLATGAALVAGTWILMRTEPVALDRAGDWCEAQRPNLEAYRAAHGSYPTELAAAGVRADDCPMRVEYWSDGTRFDLTIADPRDFTGFAFWYRDPMSGRWKWNDG